MIRLKFILYHKLYRKIRKIIFFGFIFYLFFAFSNRYSHLELFAQALHIIKIKHINPSSDESMIFSAIKGILLNLDPYSEILNLKDFKELDQETSGKHYGIGIEVERSKSSLVIVSIIKDSPADKAGLLPGDILFRINNSSTKQMTPRDFKKLLKTSQFFLIRGKRADGSLFMKEMKLEMMDLPSIFLTEVQEGLFYLKINTFTEQTTLEISQALKDKNIKALLIDIRFNKGGILEESYKIADLFLQKGVLARYRIQAEYKETVFKAHHAPYLGDFPLVVLINEFSASASELLAAALQDQKRATLVGRQSFGKGLIQETFPLKGDYFLSLSVGEYKTPLGKTIHKKGITPDRIIPFHPRISFNVYKDYKKDPEVSQALKLAKALIKTQ